MLGMTAFQTIMALLGMVVAILGGTLGMNLYAWKTFSSRIDKVDEKIDTVKTGLEAKIDTVKTDLQADIGTLDKKIDTSFGTLDKKIDTDKVDLGTKIDTVKTDLEAKITDLGQRVSVLDNRVYALGVMVGGLRNDIRDAQARFDDQAVVARR